VGDYYSTLGVERSASQEEIKKAYRKLSMEHHPDHNSGNKESEDKFKEISVAYATLSDVNKRQEYDNPDPMRGMFGGFPGGFPGFGQRQHSQKPDLNAPRDGSMLGIEAQIPLKIFIFGGKYKINFSYHEGCETCGGKGFEHGTECDMCHGEGYFNHVERRPGFMTSSTQPCPKCQARGIMGTDTCAHCKGSGNVTVENKEFEFNIPPNATIGSRFALSGVGRAGLNGGRRGDVVMMVVGVAPPDLSKLTSGQMAELRFLLETLDNAPKNA
jgi:molecular chaperone DnaJ